MGGEERRKEGRRGGTAKYLADASMGGRSLQAVKIPHR